MDSTKEAVKKKIEESFNIIFFNILFRFLEMDNEPISCRLLLDEIDCEFSNKDSLGKFFSHLIAFNEWIVIVLIAILQA